MPSLDGWGHFAVQHLPVRDFSTDLSLKQTCIVVITSTNKSQLVALKPWEVASNGSGRASNSLFQITDKGQILTLPCPVYDWKQVLCIPLSTSWFPWPKLVFVAEGGSCGQVPSLIDHKDCGLHHELHLGFIIATRPSPLWITEWKVKCCYILYRSNYKTFILKRNTPNHRQTSNSC